MPTKGREMELVYQLGYVAKQDVIYEWSQSTKTKATASKKQQSNKSLPKPTSFANIIKKESPKIWKKKR